MNGTNGANIVARKCANGVRYGIVKTSPANRQRRRTRARARVNPMMGSTMHLTTDGFLGDPDAA